MPVKVTLIVECPRDRAGDLAEAIADVLPQHGGGSVEVTHRIERPAAPESEGSTDSDLEGYAE